jgi:uroporphyrinogen III methyltransferase/synthase
VVERLRGLLPGAGFEIVPFTTPGDRDRTSDLRTSPGDFFTLDLDLAVLDGRTDFAVHSAKDLPDTLTEGLDWCWLPWAEDPRDALVVRAPLTLGTLPPDAVIGVSSGRREDYCRVRFPGAQLKSIRGDIDARLAQLDRGDYDVLLMAGAALVRLGLQDRITEWISVADLAPPAGQGYLALTFRAGDAPLQSLRGRFVKAVRFVGAGVGRADFCTLAGIKALRAAEVCLHDTLMDPRLLEVLPPDAVCVDVGKRCGAHAMPQEAITRLVADWARRGRRVVRLKGGDPGIFGRLAEEIECLGRLDLPYRIIPGVSSMNAAATGSGLLLTRRGVNRGFTVMTPRGEGGAILPVNARARSDLPLVLFMATQVIDAVAEQLMGEGVPGDTPAAVIFEAGGDDERTLRAPLAKLAAAMGQAKGAAGLVIVGEICRYGCPMRSGALRGRRVLLTCSESLQDKASLLVEDLGGVPLCRPLIRLTPAREACEQVRAIAGYDWIAITSPSAVRCLDEILTAEHVDRRGIRGIMACGEGTAAALRAIGLGADVMPAERFGADSLGELARAQARPGIRILRLRSDKAGDDLAGALRAAGADVRDCVLYANTPLTYDHRPDFEVVFFASASSVEAYMRLWGRATLSGKVVLAIGMPTAEALRKAGAAPDLLAAEATVEGAMAALAQWCVHYDIGQTLTT